MVGMSKEFKKYETYGAYHWVGHSSAPFRTYDPELAANYQVAAKAFREAANGLVSGCVLDAGCGDGVMTATLLKVDQEVQVVCLDGDPTGIVLARQELGRRVRRPPSLVQGMCERLPFKTRIFTAVMAIEVIEHLERPETFLQEAYRVLKDNGILVLTTPRRGDQGIPHSRFHFQEFSPLELHLLLGLHFPSVRVGGYRLSVISRCCYGFGFPPLRWVCRLAVKVLSHSNLNPFSLVTFRSWLINRCENLVAVCQK